MPTICYKHMKLFCVTLLFFSITAISIEPMNIYKLSDSENLEGWYILDDGVMGGKSQGLFSMDADGYGVFSGEVSLENNGGFSSVRYMTGKRKVDGYKECVFRVKGDGKKYQLRLKSHREEAFSYIQHFETSGEWQTITIDLASFYPTFRGRVLDMPNYPSEVLSELSFLISNKKAESFSLKLDWMELR